MLDLSIKAIEGQKVIDFANNSKDFVEVVFTIDGREVKEGRPFDAAVKGYGYPPKLQKPVKKMKDGSPLPFGKHGEVLAYVYAGSGSYKDEDLSIPTFLRHQLAKRIGFKRISNEPIKVLKATY